MLGTSDIERHAPLFLAKAAAPFAAACLDDLEELWGNAELSYWVVTLSGSVYHRTQNHTQYLTRGWIFVTRGSPLGQLAFNPKDTAPWKGLYLAVENNFSKSRLEYVTSQFGSLLEVPPSSRSIRLARRLCCGKQPDLWSRSRLAFEWFHAWWKEMEEHHQRIVKLLDSRESALEFAHENLSLKALAAQLGYSPGYLSGILGRRWQEKPARLLRRERLEAAAKKLIDSDIKVEALASELGYQSPSSFIRVFRETHGMSPARYRATHRDG